MNKKNFCIRFLYVFCYTVFISHISLYSALTSDFSDIVFWTGTPSSVTDNNIIIKGATQTLNSGDTSINANNKHIIIFIDTQTVVTGNPNSQSILHFNITNNHTITVECKGDVTMEGLSPNPLIIKYRGDGQIIWNMRNKSKRSEILTFHDMTLANLVVRYEYYE